MFSAMLLILLSGCSAAGPTATPAVPNTIECNDLISSRCLWGVYSWVYDKDAQRIDAIPLRNTTAHWDVTAYLEPPECNDCLGIEILSITEDPNDIWVWVTLKNPTIATAKDVRGIFLDENQGIVLMDPVAWTPTWDWHYPQWHNAFHPFMAHKSDRKFGPGASDTLTYRLRFPDDPDFSGVRYIVDACWPVHCGEPYEFEYVTKSGTLGTESTDWIFLAAKLFDWQMDPLGVRVDLSDLGFPGEIWMDYAAGQWFYELLNQYSKPEGKYSLRFTAYDQEVSNVISHYMDLYVSDDKYGPVWIGADIGIQEAFPGDRSAWLEYGTAQDMVSPGVTYNAWMDAKPPYDFDDAVIITDIGKSPKTIYGLKNGKQYVFMVRAMDSSGNTEWNNVIKAVVPGG